MKIQLVPGVTWIATCSLQLHTISAISWGFKLKLPVRDHSICGPHFKLAFGFWNHDCWKWIESDCRSILKQSWADCDTSKHGVNLRDLWRSHAWECPRFDPECPRIVLSIMWCPHFCKVSIIGREILLKHLKVASLWHFLCTFLSMLQKKFRTY